MRPRGLAEVERAKADGRWAAAYAPASTARGSRGSGRSACRKPQGSGVLFAALTGANRYRAVLYRIGAVKRAETRARKIAAFVADARARRDHSRLSTGEQQPRSRAILPQADTRHRLTPASPCGARV